MHENLTFGNDAEQRGDSRAGDIESGGKARHSLSELVAGDPQWSAIAAGNQDLDENLLRELCQQLKGLAPLCMLSNSIKVYFRS